MYPWLTPVLLAIWQTIELYLGWKKPMDAGSGPQLLWRILCTIQIRLANRKNKGAPVMATNPNARAVSVTVDGPTYDILALGVDVIKKVLSGEKPQQVVQEELGVILAQV